VYTVLKYAFICSLSFPGTITLQKFIVAVEIVALWRKWDQVKLLGKKK
jgi:hypothetical protein